MLTVSCKNRVGGRQFCHPRAPSVQCICSGEKFSVGCRIQVRQRICAGQWNFRGRNDISVVPFYGEQMHVGSCWDSMDGSKFREQGGIEDGSGILPHPQPCGRCGDDLEPPFVQSAGGTRSVKRLSPSGLHFSTDRSRLLARRRADSGRWAGRIISRKILQCARSNATLEVIGNTDSTLGGISVGFVFKLRRFGPKHRA